MYQVHYTLNNLTTSYKEARAQLNDSVKLIEHYNIVNGIKHYEILTSSNHTFLPVLSNIGFDTIRIKVETTKRPLDWLYIEKHYKLNSIPENLSVTQDVMLTEVIEPTTHKYIVTIRGISLEEISKIESKFKMTPIKTTTEYCIMDTNEKLDYVHI